MQVTVRFSGPLRALAGCPQRDLTLSQGATLRDLLHALAGVLPAAFAGQVLAPLEAGTAPLALVLVNRSSLQAPSDLDRPLSAGDVVAFVPPMSGG